MSNLIIWFFYTWQSWLTVHSYIVSFISFPLTLFESISVCWSIWPFSLMSNENFLVTQSQFYQRHEMSVQFSWVSVVYISLVQLLILSQHSGWWQAASAGQGRHAGLSRSPLSVRDSDRSHLTPHTRTQWSYYQDQTLLIQFDGSRRVVGSEIDVRLVWESDSQCTRSSPQLKAPAWLCLPPHSSPQQVWIDPVSQPQCTFTSWSCHLQFSHVSQIVVGSILTLIYCISGSR